MKIKKSLAANLTKIEIPEEVLLNFKEAVEEIKHKDLKDMSKIVSKYKE